MTPAIPFAEGQFVAGQPTPEHLAALAGQGVRTVINLRASGEAVEYDEAAEAGRLGLRYVHLPVSGAADLDADRVAAFGRALDDARQAGGVLVHCASANRAGALLALDAAMNRGLPVEEALALGRSAGLSTLEPAVVALVQREGAAP